MEKEIRNKWWTEQKLTNKIREKERKRKQSEQQQQYIWTVETRGEYIHTCIFYATNDRTVKWTKDHETKNRNEPIRNYAHITINTFPFQC